MGTFFYLLAATLLSTTAETCSSEQHREFDFWLGHWEITQRVVSADGQVIELPARTVVTRAASGCALVEHWTGKVQFPWEGMERPELMHGISVRYFHQREKRWYIHWLDSRNVHFGDPFVGGFENGVGTFTVIRDTPEGPRRTRILFRQLADDHVSWSLAVETGEDEWHTPWTMDMHRVEAE